MKLSLQPSMARSQRGYSLVELSIALAILSVVIIGALVGVQRILDNNRANNVLRQIPMTNASLIAATTSTGGTFAGVNSSVLGALGSFPDGSLAGNGLARVARNPFNGFYYGVTMNPNVAGMGGANTGYFVVVTGIPNSMCSTIANGVASLARGVWVVNGTLNQAQSEVQATITPAASQVKAAALGSVINLANLATGCAGNAATKTVSMLFSR